MKTVFTFLIILLSISLSAQTKLAINISMGSSFKGILTNIGGAAGVIGPKGNSSLMLTIESDQIFNSDLLAFNMADRIKPLEDGSIFSNNLGILYTCKLYSYGKFSAGLSVQPWTSLNIHVASINPGAQVSFNSKGDMISLQYSRDARYSRNFIKLIFTVTQKHRER